MREVVATSLIDLASVGSGCSYLRPGPTVESNHS